MAELRIVVCLHLYYQDQWAEFLQYLKNIPHEFTLFVTVPEGHSLSAPVHRSYPDAQVWTVANVGRDVAPFLSLLKELQAFDVVCKLHTKRDQGLRRGWRREALAGLLGSRRLVSSILRTFHNRPRLLYAGPHTLYAEGGMNTEQSLPLILKHAGSLPAIWGFFAGTMFWARPQLLRDLDSVFPNDMFVTHDDDDGHPEHAIERYFGLLAAKQRGEIALTSTGFLKRPVVKVYEAASLRGAKSLPLQEWQNESP